MPDTGTGYRLELLVSGVNVGIAAVGHGIMEDVICNDIINCCSGIPNCALVRWWEVCYNFRIGIKAVCMNLSGNSIRIGLYVMCGSFTAEMIELRGVEAWVMERTVR
jgi:hypothetical protein